MRVAALPALQGDRPVAQFVGEAGAGEHLFVAEAVALHVPVPAPQAAVQTVLLADVAVFDQAAQVDAVVQPGELDLQGALEQRFHPVSFGRKDELDLFPVQVRFAEYVFEGGCHGAYFCKGRKYPYERNKSRK